jgi:hypothetical protein
VTPYIAFGVVGEAPELFREGNDRGTFLMNCLHVSEFNVMGWLHEWASGRAYTFQEFENHTARELQEIREAKAAEERRKEREAKVRTIIGDS